MTTSNDLSAKEIIKLLKLEPLPKEGGFYRQTYISRQSVLAFKQDCGTPFKRKAATAIYYMVTPESFSFLHRLRFDEIFHFYLGDSLEMIQINHSGNLEKIKMGHDLIKGEFQQVVVPAVTWQGTKLAENGKWALLGTQVSPGFDFDDFELGKRDFLLEKFPLLEKEIFEYTPR